jgi:hypothetical protein
MILQAAKLIGAGLSTTAPVGGIRTVCSEITGLDKISKETKAEISQMIFSALVSQAILFGDLEPGLYSHDYNLAPVHVQKPNGGTFSYH